MDRIRTQRDFKVEFRERYKPEETENDLRSRAEGGQNVPRDGDGHTQVAR